MTTFCDFYVPENTFKIENFLHKFHWEKIKSILIFSKYCANIVERQILFGSNSRKGLQTIRG